MGRNRGPGGRSGGAGLSRGRTLAGGSAALPPPPPLPVPLARLQTAAAPGPRWILGVPVVCRWSKMPQLPALAVA